MSIRASTERGAPEALGPLSQTDDPGAGAAAARSQSEDGQAPASASPPLVIRGKSVRASLDPDSGEAVFCVEDEKTGAWHAISGRSAATPAHAAITDWLNFSFPFQASQDRVGALLQRFLEVLGRKFLAMVERPMGKLNYERSVELGEGLKAFFCYGGAQQRETATLSLSGVACSVVADWPGLIELGREALQGRI